MGRGVHEKRRLGLGLHEVSAGLGRLAGRRDRSVFQPSLALHSHEGHVDGVRSGTSRCPKRRLSLTVGNGRTAEDVRPLTSFTNVVDEVVRRGVARPIHEEFKMTIRRLKIPGTVYRRMTVLDGAHHRVRVRFVDASNIGRDRGTLHTIICRAAGYRGTRRLTERRAAKGRWHVVDIGRRDLTRRMMVDLEPLAVSGVLEFELDGRLVRLRGSAS